MPTFSRNEMGATFGGPIIRDKLFIFGAIDVLRSSSTSSGQYTVETQDLDNYVSTNYPNSVANAVLKAAPPLSFPTSGIQTVSQIAPDTLPPLREFPAPWLRLARRTSASRCRRTATSGTFAAITTWARTTAST